MGPGSAACRLGSVEDAGRGDELEPVLCRARRRCFTRDRDRSGDREPRRSVKPAFWDTSALVALCVQQQPSPAVRQMLEQHEIAVWWATPVEMRSAFERLLRMKQLTSTEHAAAGVRLEKLRSTWRELQPSEALRAQAEAFLMNYPIKAVDALQLASAWTWCAGDAPSCIFLSGDLRLMEAARQVGFEIVAA